MVAVKAIDSTSTHTHTHKHTHTPARLPTELAVSLHVATNYCVLPFSFSSAPFLRRSYAQIAKVTAAAPSDAAGI